MDWLKEGEFVLALAFSALVLPALGALFKCVLLDVLRVRQQRLIPLVAAHEGILAVVFPFVFIRIEGIRLESRPVLLTILVLALLGVMPHLLATAGRDERLRDIARSPVRILAALIMSVMFPSALMAFWLVFAMWCYGTVR